MFFKSKEVKPNPFAIQPNTKLVGVKEEKEKLVKYITNGNICFLNGPPGVGKSSLLEWVKENLKNHYVLYLDAKEVDEYFILKRYLKKNRPLWRFIFKKYAKNVVLLLDEAQAADNKFIDSLEVFWNKKVIKSIVVTQIKPHLSYYPDSFKHRLGLRAVRLDKLNSVRVHELINLRTNKKHPFTDDAIDLIAEKADFVPRKILEHCEVVMVEIGEKDKISESDVEDVFEKKEAEELEQEAIDLDSEEPDDAALIPLENVDMQEGISPMEKRIIKLLLEKGKTAVQLATILNTSAGSVGKQLSKLSKTDVVCVENHRRPKVYGITSDFKLRLNKEVKKGSD